MTRFPRPELEQLKKSGYQFEETWQVIDLFEKKLADYFGSPYAVVVDCCTHGLELCFRLINQPDQIVHVPVHTYMSVPMMLEKIHQPWQFVDTKWQESYRFDPLPVVDAAYLWRRNSYQSNTLTCVSFQHKKHLCIGKGGVILTDRHDHYTRLQRMCRDGRDPKLLWTNDDISEIGYHYFMTPDDAARGIMMFDQLCNTPARVFGWQDYKLLTEYSVFSHRLVI